MPGRMRRPTKPIDPTLAALRARQEEDRKRREAEAAARHREWAEQAPEWAEQAPEWAEQARQAQKQRRKPPTVEQVRERVRKQEERDQARQWAAYQEGQRRAEEFRARMADIDREFAERRMHSEEQAGRDEAYARHLLSIGATAEYLRELARRCDALSDREYGQPGHMVYHAFEPRADWFVSSAPDSPAPYAVLGVKPDATWDEVKAAHRRLVMKHHPDRGGDVAEFRRVQSAYEAIEKAHHRRHTG